MTTNTTPALQTIAARELANVDGGMRFNPNATLDTSHVDDYRKGQPFLDKVRAWWTQLTHRR